MLERQVSAKAERHRHDADSSTLVTWRLKLFIIRNIMKCYMNFSGSQSETTEQRTDLTMDLV